jgi:hypothetical protein
MPRFYVELTEKSTVTATLVNAGEQLHKAKPLPIAYLYVSAQTPYNAFEKARGQLTLNRNTDDLTDKQFDLCMEWCER